MQVSESADTNGGNELGNTGLESITRVFGALDLQQFWPKSDLFLEYLGGGAFYSNPYDAQANASRRLGSRDPLANWPE